MRPYFCFLFILYSLELFAGKVDVCPSCKVTGIQEGVDMASSGDTVLVQSGTYFENNITIKKSIHLLGEDYPVVDGNNKGSIFLIEADNVTLRGFQIQNVGTSYIKDWAAIDIERAEACVIKNNKLINTFFGIYLKHTKKTLIENNEIIGSAVEEISSGNAIHLWYCKAIRIFDNTTKNHRDGIYLEFVDNSQIKGNLSEGHLRYGLHFMFANDNEYHRNVFRNNGAGVAVMFSRNISMTANRFEKNWGSSSYGLLLKEIYDGEITGNTFDENTVGIYAESANRLMIAHNEFKSNGWALKILGSSMDNTFTNNNFMANTFDLSTNSSRNYNNYEGNYWSEYSGYDLDKDGIGDQPHRPVKLFSFVINQVDASIILLRSPFIDLLNFAEKITPVFTPAGLIDNKPLIHPVQ